MFWVLLDPIWNQSWLQGFRAYFANDQLSYAAIAVTASKGNFWPVEPLTETGTSHYPSLWYLVLGAISNISGHPVYVIWSLLGLALVGIVLAFLGVVAYRFSGLALAPLFPGLALLTGTLSVFTSHYWFTSISNHAVLWGPFGELFALNAGAVGIMLNVTAMAFLLSAAALSLSPKMRSAAVVACAAILGLLANIQTYSFLTGVSLAAAFLAIYGLLRYPSRSRALVTTALITVLLLAGPFLATVIDPLPLFVMLLIATFPATYALIRAHAQVSAIAGVTFLLLAAPQVVRTLAGIATGDDFLAYRQTSTVDLSAPWAVATVAALPLIGFAAFTGLTLIATRSSRNLSHQAFTAMLLALLIAIVLFTENDQWGFNQEPYRFWLQYSIVAIFLLSITTAWSLRQWRDQAIPWRFVTASTAAIAVIIWTLSLTDVLSFRTFAKQQGVITAQGERAEALQTLIPTDAGLVLSSSCLDPQVLKLITRAPVAFFNRGLAWPQNRVALDPFLDPNRSRDLTVTELQAANITDILTDSACIDEWRIGDARVQPIDIAEYSEGRFTRWQVRGASS